MHSQTALILPFPRRAGASADASHFVGAKYEPAMTITEIAAACRKDIKAAITTGALPRDMVTSVLVEKYSGGQTLRIVVRQCSVLVVNPERILWDQANPYGVPTEAPAEAQPLHSKQGARILGALQEIADAYNYDRSDSNSDVFNRNFYCHPAFAGELTAFQRAQIRALPVSVRVRAKWWPGFFGAEG